MVKMGRRALLALGIACFAAPAWAEPQDKRIVMASTMSTEQSGLFTHLRLAAG